jgi:chaperonin GroES
LKIRPVFDRLVVEKIEQADKTRSGLLYIPDEGKSPSQLGRVLEVGHGRNYDGPGGLKVFPGYSTLPEGSPTVGVRPSYVVEYQRPAMVVKVGDHVIFGKYSGSEVQLDGHEVFILREDEVLAIVEVEAGDDKPAAAEPTLEATPVH